MLSVTILLPDRQAKIGLPPKPVGDGHGRGILYEHDNPGSLNTQSLQSSGSPGSLAQAALKHTNMARKMTEGVVATDRAIGHLRPDGHLRLARPVGEFYGVGLVVVNRWATRQASLVHRRRETLAAL